MSSHRFTAALTAREIVLSWLDVPDSERCDHDLCVLSRDLRALVDGARDGRERLAARQALLALRAKLPDIMAQRAHAESLLVPGTLVLLLTFGEGGA